MKRDLGNKVLRVTMILNFSLTKFVFTCSSKKEDTSNTAANNLSNRSTLFVFEDDTEWGDGYLETGTKNDCEIPIFPNVGYSFRGYNILLGNPFHADTDGDPGFRLPIFKASHFGRRNADMSYRLPDGIHGYKKIICKVDTESKEIVNAKAYQKDLLRNLGGGVGGILQAFLPISFSANAAYQRTTHKLSNEKHLFVKTENECNVFEIQLDKNKPPKFADGFLIAAKRLEDVEDSHAYADFLKDYGTHYIETTHMGARFAIETEFSQQAKSTVSRDNFNIKMAAGLNFKLSFGLNAGLGTNEELVEQFQELQKSHSILSYGSPMPKDERAVTWARSVFENPLPIDYKLGEIQNLFTDRFMSDVGTRKFFGKENFDYNKIREGLIKYLTNYCIKEKDNLGISECVGPDGGCDGGNDCHHNADCLTIQTRELEDTFECKCFDGYEGNGKTCTGWNAATEVLEHDRYESFELDRVWGSWHVEEKCARNSYAYALALKVEPEQSGGFLGRGKDNSALNGVKLYCMDPKTKEEKGDITSGVGGLGSWTKQKSCFKKNDLLTGYRFRAEGPARRKGDRIFGVSIDVRCQSGSYINGEEFKLDQGKWGEWGRWSSETSCPTGSAVCGIQTKILPIQLRRKDDVGLTDIKLICCKF